jgi:subtilase family serine protease
VKPLWDSGIDGRGQTIAIVARTNINVQDIRDFRKLFGLPPNDPQIIVNGPDPGILGPTSASFDEIEAIADVTWSGAVAKNATIKMVASALTNTTDGVDLSSEYIIDNNLAPVMSESYAGCELVLGTVGNQFNYNQWQQAAAQGITAFVVTGDVGSPECDEGLKFLPTAVAVSGFGVNGLASTPFNVAVGGTDFNDYFNPTQYWSLTNDPTTQASALSYIPETASNISCVSPIFTALGFSADPIANCNNPSLAHFVVLGAGSGGPSNCTVSDGLNLSSCQGGYSKPAWQSGLGVPADGKRDLPDVSLTMAGFGSFYIMCEADLSSSGACDLNAPFLDFIGIGGTSLAAPSFAGIQALVSQKTQARQGNANYVYYKLATEQPVANCDASTGPATTCIFNDVTSGTNAMPCAPASPDCATEGSLSIGVLTGYNAGVGYDLTTGLGSVNAYNLVHGWKSVAFEPTSTQLELSPRFIVHGQIANVEIAVTSKFGTPTGQVSVIAANSPFTLNNQSDGVFTLGNNGTVSSTTQLLPGGFYTVMAHYGGDGVFGQSDSEPISVAVSPEPSTTVVSAFLCSTSLFICAATTQAGAAAGTPFSSAPYGTYVFLRANVAGKSGFGNATGLVQFTDGERLIPGDPYGLNTGGSVSYYQPATAAAITPNGLATFEPGAHHIRASYGGDSSFHPSSSQPVVFTITKAPTQTALLAGSATTVEGAGVTLTATVSTSSYGNPPAGKIAFFSGAKLLGSPVSVTGGFDPVAGTAVATAALTTTRLAAGQDNVTAKYIGDENYAGSTSAPVEITVTEQ